MKKWFGFLPVLVAMIFYACGGSGGGSGSVSEPTSTGILKVSVTDAPFPFKYVESASVVIREVWVRHADGSGFEEQLLDDPVEIDLVPLTGGFTKALVKAEIPVGTYDQARLIVDAGTVVLSYEAYVSSSRTFSTALGNMKFPSAAQSGIKVNINPPVNVVTQLSADLTLDFDLTKSFVFNGPPTHAPGVKRVLFKPVIRAINNSEYGRITVRVLSDSGTPSDSSDDIPLAGATVTAYQANEEQAVTATDDDGIAWLQLPPGTYDVQIEADGYETALLEDKSVIVANETPLGDVTLVLTLGQISGVVLGDSGTPGDASDDVVLEGVTVTIFSAGSILPLVIDPPGQNPILTDAQGAYQFDGLIPGDYDLTFEKAGFQSGMLTGVTASPSGIAPDVTLALTLGQISGVALGDSGTPGDASDDVVLEGVTVTIFNAGSILPLAIDPPGQNPILTDAQGAYQFDGLIPGDYDLTFEKAGFQSGMLTGVTASPSGIAPDVTLMESPNVE